MGHFEKTVNFLQLWPSCILFGCKMQGNPFSHCKLYFLRSKKNNIKWRRRRKKIRVWCKKCSFLHHRVTQCTLFRGSLTCEAFFCEESGAGGRRKTESRIPLFFFIFPQTSKQGPSLVLKKNAKSGSEFFFWVSRGFGPWGACLGFFGFSELYPHCGGVISEKWTSS